MGTARREAFVRGFSDDVIIDMLGPNPTQERFRLADYYLTDLAFQASRDGPLGWGEFMERYTAMYPCGQPGLSDDPVTAYINNLHTIDTAPGSVTARGHGPCDATTPRGSATSAWPLHRAAPNRSQHRATAVPMPNGDRCSTNSRRRDASSTRSWPFYTKSSARMPSLAIGNRHRTFLCTGRPARGTATGTSAARLWTSRMAGHLCRRHVDQCPTTTDAPM
jgi:hypothetical protein